MLEQRWRNRYYQRDSCDTSCQDMGMRPIGPKLEQSEFCPLLQRILPDLDRENSGEQLGDNAQETDHN